MEVLEKVPVYVGGVRTVPANVVAEHCGYYGQREHTVTVYCEVPHKLQLCRAREQCEGFKHR